MSGTQQMVTKRFETQSPLLVAGGVLSQVKQTLLVAGGVPDPLQTNNYLLVWISSFPLKSAASMGSESLIKKLSGSLHPAETPELERACLTWFQFFIRTSNSYYSQR